MSHESEEPITMPKERGPQPAFRRTVRAIASVVVASLLHPAPALAWSSKGYLPLFETVHQNAIQKVLGEKGVVEGLRNAAIAAQVSVDEDQSTKSSYKHSMCGASPELKPAPDIGPWIGTANDFISSELKKAIQAGNTEEGFSHLGAALHVMTDSSSPSHERFQRWDENESIFDKLAHVMQERSYPDEADAHRIRLEGAVRWGYAIFTKADQLPASFFTPDGNLALPSTYQVTP